MEMCSRRTMRALVKREGVNDGIMVVVEDIVGRQESISGRNVEQSKSLTSVPVFRQQRTSRW